MAHPVVSREDWLAARRAHLEDEKAFTKARDALSARRRALPWVRIEKDYTFTTPDGEVALGDLFAGKSQLAVMHFMFGPDWQEGCPSCSFWADGFNGMDVHLAHRDTAFVAISNTGLDRIERYRARMGWTFPWVSALGSDFNQDFQVSFSGEDMAEGLVEYNYTRQRMPVSEAPGLSVFHKPGDGTIVHTYSTYARGLDILNTAYHLLDMTPKGRDEQDLDFTMAWIRRHDSYED